MKGWFEDKDHDSYHAQAKGATTSPGSDWTNSTKGPDCNDEVASADNSVCVAQTPTTPPAPKPDPCAEIKKALADAKYKETMAKLDNPVTLHLPNETGYWLDKNGEYHAMEIDGARTCEFPQDRSTMQNVNHVHQEPWSVVQSNGSTTYEASYIMPSRQDLWDTYYLIVNAQYHNIPLDNIYMGTTNSLGNYQIRFTGDPATLTYASINRDHDSFVESEEYKNKYEKAMDEYGNEAGMLYFINTVLGKTDLTLYKIETTGGVKLSLGENNTVTRIPCIP